MLLARMAESVYWAGRYLERAECTARIVQVHTDAHVDIPVGEDVGWEPLLAIADVGIEFSQYHSVAAHAGNVDASEHDVIEFLLHNQENPSSILAAISAARENLRTARPVVPREAWEAGNALWLACTDHLEEAQTREGAGPVAPPGHRRMPEDQRHLARHHEPRRSDVLPLDWPKHRTRRPDHPSARCQVSERAPQAGGRFLRRRALDGRTPVTGCLPTVPPSHAGAAPWQLHPAVSPPGRPVSPSRDCVPVRNP